MQFLHQRPADTRRTCAAAGASVRKPRSGSDPLDACRWGALTPELNLSFTERSQRDFLVRIDRQSVVPLYYHTYIHIMINKYSIRLSRNDWDSPEVRFAWASLIAGSSDADVLGKSPEFLDHLRGINDPWQSQEPNVLTPWPPANPFLHANCQLLIVRSRDQLSYHFSGRSSARH
jgi:hypothetical protein